MSLTDPPASHVCPLVFAESTPLEEDGLLVKMMTTDITESTCLLALPMPPGASANRLLCASSKD